MRLLKRSETCAKSFVEKAKRETKIKYIAKFSKASCSLTSTYYLTTLANRMTDFQNVFD